MFEKIMIFLKRVLNGYSQKHLRSNLINKIVFKLTVLWLILSNADSYRWSLFIVLAKSISSYNAWNCYK